MRLLIFAAHFHPKIGGVENYVLELSRRLGGMGIDCMIVTFNTMDAPAEERVEGVRVVRLPCISVLGGEQAIPLPGAWKALRALGQERWDAVNTHTRFYLTAWLGARFAQKHGLPLIHTEHGNRHVTHPNPIVTACAWLYDMTLGRLPLRAADKVVCISKAGIPFAERMGASKEDIVYLPNAIDMKAVKRTASSLRARLGIPKKRRIITYVGRLIHAKGVQDLFQAVAPLRDIDVVIVGDGPYRAALERSARSFGVRAHFLGQLQVKGVYSALSGSDLFVNPSYSEGLPTSVLEAAALGVPAIATDVGGTREILPEDCLFAPRDVEALRSLIGREPDEKRTAQVQRRVRRTFGLDTVARRFAALLNTLV